MIHDTSKQTKLEILNYFFWYSEPKYSRGKKWYVLCPNQFGKESGPKRTTFVKYRRDLEVDCLIVKIEPIKDKGNFYSISPLGLCFLAREFLAEYYSKQQVDRFLKILEPFTEKNNEPVKSIFFRKQQFKINNIQNKLENSLGSGTVGHFLPKIFQLFEFNENFIYFSIPILHQMVSCKILQFKPDGSFGSSTRLLEYDPDMDNKYNFIKLSVFQFYSYFSILLVSSLLYIAAKTSFDPHYQKLERDLTYVTLKNGKRQRGVIIKPDQDRLSNLDVELFSLVVSLNNSIEKVLKQSGLFHNNFMQVLNKSQFTKSSF